MKRMILFLVALAAAAALIGCAAPAPDMVPEAAAQLQAAANGAASEPVAESPLIEADTLAQAEPAAEQADIGMEEAQRIALADAGLTAEQVTMVGAMRSSLDREDGRMAYEIDFRCGGFEYEY